MPRYLFSSRVRLVDRQKGGKVREIEAEKKTDSDSLSLHTLLFSSSLSSAVLYPLTLSPVTR